MSMANKKNKFKKVNQKPGDAGERANRTILGLSLIHISAALHAGVCDHICHRYVHLHTIFQKLRYHSTMKLEKSNC